MEVRIPFRPMFEEPMRTGVKTCTSRSKIMGQPGDRFRAFGKWFEIVSVEDVALCEVAALWKEEGCESREDFIEVWNSIHPVKKYSDYQRVYLHRFKHAEAEP